ncbi:restriction endonuclease subunit S [Sporosarcina sp. SAFN-015]|uniref:restriction endonuclease subunit S n=1 Tax=Sporosarcina sp. SAFN-015 TaxID=3387274 RepID=UPI003F7FA69B
MGNNNEPEVRFPGFTDTWGQAKLGNSVKFINGRAYKQQELLDKGKYRVLRVGNFNTNDRWYYSDLELEDNKYANPGDLLYLWATSFGPEIWNEERVIYHYHIWKLEIEDSNIDKQYLYTWLENDKERIKQTTNGTTMVHITKASMEERRFHFPVIKEQQSIGKLFKQIDKNISLHKQELTALKQTKQGFLQKMFPKEGKYVPEVRFPGFSGEWVSTKAKKIFKAISEKNHPELPVISASQEKGMVYRKDLGINISYDAKSTITYKRVTPGQFVIHLRSFQGGFAFSNIEGITSPAYTVLDFIDIEKHYPVFWKYVLSSNSFIKKLEGVTYGIRDGRSISYHDFSTLKLLVPSYEEQVKIGSFLLKIDKTIALQEKELEALQQTKKAFLQKMFV